MRKAIDEYLANLRKALAGADRATIQDALADAEEHLTTELDQNLEGEPGTSADERFHEIVERFGSPEEVAAAYKELEAKTAPTLMSREQRKRRSAMSRFFGVLADLRAYAAVLYMFFSLATGIIYFSWAVTGLALSIGLKILIIGLPVLTLFLLSFRGVALLEGRLVEAVLGERMPRRPVFFRRELGWWGGFKALFADRTTWTALLYMILQLPLGIIYFTIIVTLIALSLGCILQPILKYVFDLPIVIDNDWRFYMPDWAMPLVVIGGFLLLILTMHLARLIGRFHGRYAKALLVKGE